MLHTKKVKLKNKDNFSLQKPALTHSEQMQIKHLHKLIINQATVIRNNKQAGCQLLMPVILATQKAEIRRIAAQDQPRQTVHNSLSQK
jgi:hypothetical protein